MSTSLDMSVAAANAGELSQPKPRWMPLEGNPEVCSSQDFIQLHDWLLSLGVKSIHKTFGCEKR